MPPWGRQSGTATGCVLRDESGGKGGGSHPHWETTGIPYDGSYLSGTGCVADSLILIVSFKVSHSKSRDVE